ncbi:MAG TPA: saccharopine dehydrogenase NADP-binding domain-containing protein [Hyphomicrobiaceae bacterium]|nr:saccharopine dehydrogenase NADP-binding domain-containing protein [Hyphomicrobiaceae bacterium]
MARILIVGGYGAFGARIAERLGREDWLEIVIAGRTEAKAKEAAEALALQAAARIETAQLAAETTDAEQLGRLAPDIVINASGPFQHLGYGLARATIAAGAHYIDLADARAHVRDFHVLDCAAHHADVLAIAGASSVPALTTAVVDHFASRFARLRSVVYGISPGNSFDPGPATTASILNGLGRPFPVPFAGDTKTVYGWQGLCRRRLPELGHRFFGYCEVPDLDLFPARYPGVETVYFYAGVEVPLFHLSLWLLSWPCRFGLLRRPERLAEPLLWLKRRLSWLGSDRGGMFMTLEGTGPDEKEKRIDWCLLAGRGHGPYVPAIASVIVAKKLARGELETRGAMACQGLFSLAEFMTEVKDLDICAVTG